MDDKTYDVSRDGNPDTPELDFVFIVCDDAAGEISPYWPRQPITAHWGLPDPARATGSKAGIGLAFAGTYRMLNRASIFLLGRMSRQRHLDDIGASAHQPAG